MSLGQNQGIIPVDTRNVNNLWAHGADPTVTWLRVLKVQKSLTPVLKSVVSSPFDHPLLLSFVSSPCKEPAANVIFENAPLG